MQLRIFSFAIAVAALLAPLGTRAHDFEAVHTRADAHAPIGVMGEHMHKRGEFMLSYRYMHMRMDGNRDGTNGLSDGDVLALGYMATPTDMDVDMHMFGAMYAPFDSLTLMLMLPYVEKSMDHLNAMGVRFQTDSNGIGDLQFTGLLRLWQDEMHHVHLNAGFGFPTGSVDEKDSVPVPMLGFQRRRLPYPMQIGSGSYSLIPGLTYTGKTARWSWGAQALGTIYLDTNEHHYRVGDRFEGTAWLQRNWFKWLSTSVRLKGSVWGNYAGADPALDPAMVPTADPNLRGGSEIDPAPGVNLVLPLARSGSTALRSRHCCPSIGTSTVRSSRTTGW